MSKVIERVVYKQLIKHLEKYEITFDYQSSFRSKHSANTCLAHSSNQIFKGFEARKPTGMIIIDLQKAFDNLDHGILLKKLKYIWFSTETVRWFQSYLKKQNLIVSFDKSQFFKWQSPSRVYFESYTFLLQYTTDMKSAVNNCDLRFILSFFSAMKKLVPQKKHVNADFDSLCEWLSIHLGEDKTNCILFNKGKNSILPSTSPEKKTKSKNILKFNITQDVLHIKSCLENPWENMH